MSHQMSQSIDLYNQLAKNKLFSKTINFDLKRIKSVLKKIDHPERKYLSSTIGTLLNVLLKKAEAQVKDESSNVTIDQSLQSAS